MVAASMAPRCALRPSQTWTPCLRVLVHSTHMPTSQPARSLSRRVWTVRRSLTAAAKIVVAARSLSRRVRTARRSLTAAAKIVVASITGGAGRAAKTSPWNACGQQPQAQQELLPRPISQTSQTWMPWILVHQILVHQILVHLTARRSLTAAKTGLKTSYLHRRSDAHCCQTSTLRKGLHCRQAGTVVDMSMPVAGGFGCSRILATGRHCALHTHNARRRRRRLAARRVRAAARRVRAAARRVRAVVHQAAAACASDRLQRRQAHPPLAHHTAHHRRMRQWQGAMAHLRAQQRRLARQRRLRARQRLQWRLRRWRQLRRQHLTRHESGRRLLELCAISMG